MRTAATVTAVSTALALAGLLTACGKRPTHPSGDSSRRHRRRSSFLYLGGSSDESSKSSSGVRSG